METNRVIFANLNGLRGFAAIGVLLFHAQELFSRELAPGGYLAVDLFFVLSGFVIAHAYDSRLADGLSARSFLWMRLKRFYPLYLCGLLISAAWMMAELVFRPPAVLSWTELTAALGFGLFFLPAPGASDLYPLNPPAWSLFTELLINGAYALFFPRLTTRVLICVAVTSLGALIVLAYDSPINGGATFSSAHIGLLRAGWAFPVGILIYRLRSHFPRLNVPLAFALALALLPLLTTGLDLVAITLIFPMAVLSLSQVEVPKLGKLFNWLGAISFPLYALHFPIIQIGLAFDDFEWWVATVVLLATLPAAHLANKFLDEPFQRMLRRRSLRMLTNHEP